MDTNWSHEPTQKHAKPWNIFTIHWTILRIKSYWHKNMNMHADLVICTTHTHTPTHTHTVHVQTYLFYLAWFHVKYRSNMINNLFHSEHSLWTTKPTKGSIWGQVSATSSGLGLKIGYVIAVIAMKQSMFYHLHVQQCQIWIIHNIRYVTDLMCLNWCTSYEHFRYKAS